MSSPRETHMQLLHAILLDHWGGEAHEYQIMGPLYQRMQSHIYKVSGRRLPCTLAAKFCFEPQSVQPDKDAAQEQFLALQRLAQAMPDASFNTSRPVHAAPEAGLLLSEWIDACTLSYFLRPSIARQSQLDGLKRAGQWLAHFHRSGPFGPGSFDWQKQLADAREVASQGSPGPSFLTCMETLIAAASTRTVTRVHHSWLHGDCKIDNLLMQERRVVGIDMAMRDINAIEFDLAQFLNHLALRRNEPWQLRFVLKQIPSEPELSAAFMEGYRQVQPHIDALVLLWLRLYLLLSSWQTVSATLRPGPRAWALNWLYKKTARRLTAQLAHAAR